MERRRGKGRLIRSIPVLGAALGACLVVTPWAVLDAPAAEKGGKLVFAARQELSK